MRFIQLLFAIPLLAGIPSSVQGDSSGSITEGNARFTVVTPYLVRMEYAPDGKFVDLPSWFAVNREVRDPNAKITISGGKVEIDTGAIHLTYQDNGKPFSAENLHAQIKKGELNVSWQPGMPSTGNLGGTLRTLDGLTHAEPLGEGILSRDGWYLLEDSKSPLFVRDWIAERPQNGALDWYLFGYGLNFRAAFQSLTAVGGAIPIPRKYSLGIWYSRYWPYSADDFKKIVEEYDQHGFPLDMIVMDMDWHLNKAAMPNIAEFPNIHTWTGYTWDHALVPDPPGLLKWFHDQGLHVTLNDHPSEGIQPHEEMYASFMQAMGKDPASGKTIPFDAADKHYLDTFYQYSHLPREKEGVDFWWLDWQQNPTTVSMPGVSNLQLLNYYNFTRSSQDGLRGESFSRWAGWGDHRYPIQFSGDANTGWPMLAFEVPFTSTGGNVGAFFWSNDIGGHMGGRNEESYARWCQFGAFTAALRSHSTRNATMDRRPWTYPDWAEASMRKSFRLRSEMMPYLYTSIWQATQDSIPFLRPLYIQYPEAEPAYHNGQEYLFGDNVLVAPITTPGVGANRVASQAVWFPEGSWYDYFTGERFDGPTEGIATDSIDAFPLYVRGGVPLPMQVYTPRPGTAPLADLVLRCYPGKDGVTGSSLVYEDDGLTDGYKHGEYATTKLTYVRHGDEISVSIAPTEGTFKDLPASRRCVFEFPCTEKLISCNRADVHATYDADAMVNRIELPDESIHSGVNLVIRAAEVAPAQLAQRAVTKHLKDMLGESYAAWQGGNKVVPDNMKDALAAVQGMALIDQNMHPYLLGTQTRLLYCHNHHDTPQPVSVKIGDAPALTVSLRSGDPIPGLPGNADGLPIGPSIPVVIKSEAGLVLQKEADGFANLKDDLALKSKAEASSGNAEGAIDGHNGGYPGDRSQEWSSKGEKENSWIKLNWQEPITAHVIYLYDRPNYDDNVLGGIIEFDDGTQQSFEALPNDGTSPLKVEFSAKTFRWFKITITKVSHKTQNSGLSEIAVF